MWYNAECGHRVWRMAYVWQCGIDSTVRNEHVVSMPRRKYDEYRFLADYLLLSYCRNTLSMWKVVRALKVGECFGVVVMLLMLDGSAIFRLGNQKLDTKIWT